MTFAATSSEVIARWSITFRDLHLYARRHGLGVGAGPGRPRTYTDAELLGVWVAHAFHDGAANSARTPARQRLVDHAVRAVVADPAPYVLATPEGAWCHWTADAVLADAAARDLAVFTVVVLDVDDEFLAGALVRAVAATVARVAWATWDSGTRPPVTCSPRS